MVAVRGAGSEEEGKGTDILEVVVGSCTEAVLRDLEDRGAGRGLHIAWEVDHRSWDTGRFHLVFPAHRPWEHVHRGHTQRKQGQRQPEKRRDGTDTAG
jgi:hypothetical protein